MRKPRPAINVLVRALGDDEVAAMRKSAPAGTDTRAQEWLTLLENLDVQLRPFLLQWQGDFPSGVKVDDKSIWALSGSTVQGNFACHMLGTFVRLKSDERDDCNQVLLYMV